ncbi:PH domain-containing protein [Phytohabitans sp. ZYX-F-186]|uniref:PH domain-containing protein n=1 Tax=Phytohabitans maris TaxID=3071409 RepID=A0ABU0ZQA7_9ACTN|nr:PH domain-containing protein [Phytohabitans sp. ZYX-F-186]MDQ7909190.1 PH domain-containing protein [Phytohabitans sp. ZYX-F-186]
MSTDQPSRIRFRPHGAIAIAALVALIGAVPLASAGWYYLPILLVPIAVVAWALRAGTEVGPDGLRVRALLGERRIGWSEISELGSDRRGRVLARLTDGQVVPLTSVRDRDLPRLVKLGEAK